MKREIQKQLTNERFRQLYPEVLKLMREGGMTTVEALKEVGLGIGPFNRNLVDSQRKEIFVLNYRNVKDKTFKRSIEYAKQRIDKGININELRTYEELLLCIESARITPEMLSKKTNDTTTYRILGGTKEITISFAITLQRLKIKTARYWLVRQFNEHLDKLGL